jgi:ribonuclease BN (tRNA processing enzyme)
MATQPTTLVLLGTAGGPLPSTVRSGIAQAVVAGGRTYVVDCGSGVTRQLRRARLLSSVRSVFLTHLHSDHTCDYFSVFLLGWPVMQWNPPVDVFGPGPAGGVAALPADAPSHPVPVVRPENPTPGLIDLTAAQVRGHAYDLNVRMREAGRADLTSLIAAHEIVLPASVRASAPDDVAPEMEPFLVAEDQAVRVSATLVRHAPVFPAFAFRFDTADGSIVLSGDTAPCANLVRLARGADILVHEVFDDGARSGEPDEDEDVWEASRRHEHLVTSHTPLTDVGRVAAEAAVRRLVLTHFIPGDDTQPDEHWVKGVAGFDGEVIVGRDLLEIAL